MDGRHQRGEESVEALLAAARDEFARRGFSAASVRDIAREADVNPGLIRYHFGSKDALYQRVLDGVMAPLRDRLLDAFLQAADPDRRIPGVALAYLDYLSTEKHFPRLVQRALLDGDDRILTIARNHLRPLWEAFRASGAAASTPLGPLEEVIVSVFGALIAPSLYGPLLQAVFGQEPDSPAALARRKAHVEALLGLILRTLRPAPTDPTQEPT